MPVDRASTTHCCRTPTPHKDIHSTHTYIVYIIHTINNITTHSYTYTLIRNTQAITHKKNACHRRADVRGAPGLCVCQVLRLFLCGTHAIPMQYYLPQPHTLHIPSPHIHTHSRLHVHTHTQSIHTHKYTPMYTHAHIHTHACSTHSFTHRQCTTILVHTYTHRAAAYLTHTPLHRGTHSHTHSLCDTLTQTHTKREAHTHTLRLIIRALYTEVYTRGTSTRVYYVGGVRGQCRQYAQCSSVLTRQFSYSFTLIQSRTKNL